MLKNLTEQIDPDNVKRKLTNNAVKIKVVWVSGRDKGMFEWK